MRKPSPDGSGARAAAPALALLRRLLSPPVFPGDDDLTTAAIMVHYGILFGIVANVLAIPPMVLAGDPWWRIAGVETVIVGGLALHAVALRRGHVRGSAAVFGFFAWVALALVNATAGGVLAPGYSTHLLLILSLGFILGGRGAFTVAIASTLLGLAFLWLHQRGLLPDAQVKNTPERHFLIVSMNFFAAATVLTLMVRRFREVIAGERRALEERRAAESRLEAHKTLLEETVRQRTADLAQSNAALIAENAERGRVEESLRRERDLIGNLMETSPAGILTLDPEGRITFANAAAGRILGLNRIEIARAGHLAPDWNICGPEGRALPREAIPAAMGFAGEHPVRDARVPVRTCDGRNLLLSVNATRLSQQSGGPGGVVVTIEDITERSRQEQELFRAQKLDSVGLLAGGIAHDFNNLLAVILGSVALARETPGTAAAVAHHLELAEQAVAQARELTQQLLTFARGGSPVLQELDVGRVMRQAVEFALRGAKVRGEIEIPEGLWAVRADEGQVGQVFHNLVRNACQAMPDGGVLRVAATNTVLASGAALPLAPGPYVVIQVRDQGHGIPPETLPKIFDPYFTTKQTGSGLGLAVVYSVVRNHHGHVGVESSVGVGTTFTVHLPALGRAASVDSPPPTPASAAGAPRGGARVLAMDDDPRVRLLLERMLGLLGFEPLVVDDGAAAVAAYASARAAGQPFAAVLLDLTVPGGVGGAEALQHLRSIDADVRAVVSSGYSDDPVMAAHEEHGFRGVLPKPFRPADLERVLRRVIG